MKIANYYGCMYTRPRHIFPEKDAGPGSESTSKPHFMDDLLEAAGVDVARNLFGEAGQGLADDACRALEAS